MQEARPFKSTSPHRDLLLMVAQEIRWRSPGKKLPSSANKLTNTKVEGLIHRASVNAAIQYHRKSTFHKLLSHFTGADQGFLVLLIFVNDP